MSLDRRSCNLRSCTYVTKERVKFNPNPEISEMAEFGGSNLAKRTRIGKPANRKTPGVWMIGFQREKFVSRNLLSMRMSGFHH